MNNSFCPNCGTQNNAGSQMCMNCGTSLMAAQPMPQPVQPQPMVQPAMPQPNMMGAQPMMQPMMAQPAKKNNVGLIIGIVVGVIAFLIVIGLVFGGNKLENETYTYVKTSDSIVTTTDIHFGEDGVGYAYIESKSTRVNITPVTKRMDFTYSVSGSNITIKFDSSTAKYKIDGNCIYNVTNSDIRYCK